MKCILNGINVCNDLVTQIKLLHSNSVATNNLVTINEVEWLFEATLQTFNVMNI